MQLRALLADDLQALPRLTEATGFFTADEVAIVAELCAEAQGSNPDGYRFVVAAGASPRSRTLMLAPSTTWG